MVILTKNIEIREYLNVQSFVRMHTLDDLPAHPDVVLLHLYRAGSRILIKIQHFSSILLDGAYRCDLFLLLPVSNSDFLR